MNSRNGFMKAAPAITGILASLATVTAQAAGFALVTNSNDSGPGSLRNALEVQEADTVLIPKFVGDISINSTLEYSAQAPLSIFGNGQTISTNRNTTLLAVTDGADLKINKMNFEGPGGFSILNRGDLGVTPAGKGIFIDVRDDQTGTLNIQFYQVGVSGVANHGIHVSDCSLADDCGSGSGGGGDGSAASINLICNSCTVDDVGNGKFDADGLRIDDRGAGSIDVILRRSSFTNVGADGVELDEGDEGNVSVTTFRTDLSDNGRYCDPALLEAFLPEPDEAEFDEAEEVTEASIPGPVTGSPDDSCFEREVDLYDSGFVEAYEFAIDVDDGIDLDEAGDGHLIGVMRRSTIHRNFDEGVDFDEEGEGDINVIFSNTRAFDNVDDGFKHTEEDGGDMIARVYQGRSSNNGGKGFVFEEADEGDLNAGVYGTNTFNNDDSDDTGIEAVQEDEGTGVLRVRGSNIVDGIDTDGVDEI